MTNNQPEHMSEKNIAPSELDDAILEELETAAKTRDGVFFVSAVAIRAALNDAKNGAVHKATDLLDFAGRLPYTQVKPEHLLDVAQQAASLGNLQDALSAIRRSISLARHNDAEPANLSHEDKSQLDIAYNRTRQILRDVQAHSTVYLVYLHHKVTLGKNESSLDEQEFRQEIIDRIEELEKESKNGLIEPVYELASKGYGELAALSNHVQEILARIGEDALVKRVHRAVAHRLPLTHRHLKD